MFDGYRGTWWGGFKTLVCLTAVFAFDVWLMSLWPRLKHGGPYYALQLAMVVLLLKLLGLFFDGDPSSIDRE